MQRNAAQTFAFSVALTCLGLACAADPGDPLKTGLAAGPGSSSTGGFSGSSSSNSGSSSGFGTGSSSSSSSSSSSGGFGTSSSGGSTGSSSSSGGSGDDGGGDATIPTGATCAANSVNFPTLAYYTDDPTSPTATQSVHFHFQLQGGLAATSLQDVKVRYWFTADSNALTGITFVSYYSQFGGTAICGPCPMSSQAGSSNNVVGAFASAPAANVTPTADSYLELSFGTGTASDMLTFGGSSAVIEVVFHNTNYAGTYNETNDYSYNATKVMTPSAWDHITVYAKGQLVAGCEPGAGGSTSGGSSSSSSSGASDAGGG
jgi:Cellulose binding domain